MTIQQVRRVLRTSSDVAMEERGGLMRMARTGIYPGAAERGIDESVRRLFEGAQDNDLISAETADDAE